MANYKIVSNIDLSGNKLLDVREISRSDYSENSPYLDLLIRAGSDLVAEPDVEGGKLRLESGAGFNGTSNGNLEIIHPLHSLIFSDDFITLNTGGDVPTSVVLDTSDGSVLITTGTITIVNDLKVNGNTTLGDGIGTDVTILGSDFTLVDDDGLITTFQISNQTGNTTTIGTFHQAIPALGVGTSSFLIDVDSSPIFDVKDDGTTHIYGALYVYDTPIHFSGATDFTVGSDDSTIRTSTFYTDAIIGSVTNAKVLDIFGDTTFSNSSGNAFTNLLTDKATVNLFNVTPTTINAFGGATTVTIGGPVVDQGQEPPLTQTDIILSGDIVFKGITDYLTFNTLYNDGSLPKGSLFYSADDNALSYRTIDEEVIINLGQENVVRVRNNSGEVINNGDVVYMTGTTTGYIPDVAKANASSRETSCVLGVATHNIGVSGFGYVTTSGIVRGLALTANAGDLLYLSITPGEVTTFPPSSSNPAHFDVKIGRVVESSTGSKDAILVALGPSWSDNSTFYNMKIDTLRVRDQFFFPEVTTHTDEGSIWWDTDKIKYHTGSVIRTVVDTDSTQSLTGKTYNGLSISSVTGGFEIIGETGKELNVSSTVTFNQNYTLSTGPLVVNGHASGSQVSWPVGHLDFSALSTDNVAKKVLALVNGVVEVSDGVQLDSEGNLTVSGDIIVQGDYKAEPSSTTYNFLPEVVTTLNLATSTSTFNIGTDSATANTFNIGNSLNTSVTNFNSTKNSTAYTNGAVVIKGGLGLALNAYMNSGVYLTGNSSTHPFKINSSYSIYDDTLGSLVITGDVKTSGLNTDDSSFALLNSTVSTVNMLAVSNSTLNIGTSGANSRNVNMYSTVQIGEAANTKDLNLYGSLNIGGETGYGIQYDAIDDSINFVKLV